MKKRRCKILIKATENEPNPSMVWYTMDRGSTPTPTTRSATEMFNKKRLKGVLKLLHGSLQTATQIRRFPGTVINIRIEDIAAVVKESVLGAVEFRHCKGPPNTILLIWADCM